MSRLAVIKVGGSLLDWPGLPDSLDRYLRNRRLDRLVFLVGGGRFTDLIRDLDPIHQLGQIRSHHLALHSLDFTARLLEALVPRLSVVDQLDQLPGVWAQEQVPVLAPRAFLDEVEATSSHPLPASWDVTSDSIAARVAQALHANELVLMKSTSPPHGVIHQTDAARAGLVDLYFPSAAKRLTQVFALNLRDPSASPTLLLP